MEELSKTSLGSGIMNCKKKKNPKDVSRALTSVILLIKLFSVITQNAR